MIEGVKVAGEKVAKRRNTSVHLWWGCEPVDTPTGYAVSTLYFKLRPEKNETINKRDLKIITKVAKEMYKEHLFRFFADEHELKPEIFKAI